MFYVGYQSVPVPGKAEELKAYHRQLREIAEAHGVRQVAAFEVSLGQAPGSLIYIVGYEDADSYMAATKALADSAAWKQAAGLIASAESAVLRPLPDSRIQ